MSTAADDLSPELGAFLDLVHALGGPNIQAKDVEWAADLPAGQSLIKWIASQVLVGRDGGSAENTVEYIALETEEIKILDRVRELIPTQIDDQPVESVILPNYVLPSSQRARTTFVEREAEVIEQQVALLKQRIRETKIMSEKTSSTLRALKLDMNGLDEEIESQQGRLSELSAEVDSAIHNSIKLSSRILDDAAPDSKHTKPLHPQYLKCKSTLNALAKLRSNIVLDYQTSMREIDDIQNATLTNGAVHQEASRLHALFNFRNEHGLTLLDLAYESLLLQELTTMSDRLENGESVEQLLSGHQERLHEIDVTVDVKYEVEHAWRTDQVAILKAREYVVDKALRQFTDFNTRTTRLCDFLSNEKLQLSEVEALIGSVIKEFDEIVDDVHSTQEKRPEDSETDHGPDPVVQLTDLLKRMSKYRSPKDPPMVLLDEFDILNEIRKLTARHDRLESEENQWIASFQKQLSSLSIANSRLLSVVYDNSPMNTSPPFAPPPDLAALELETRSRIEEISNVIRQLQPKLEIEEETKLGLDSFIDKWDPLFQRR